MPAKEEKQPQPEGLYFQMLSGVFFTDLLRTSKYTVVWHQTATDYYSNLAGEFNCCAEEAPAVLEEISRFFSGRDRKTTIYLTPFAKPTELKALLQEQHFQLVYQDAWMYFRGRSKPMSLPQYVTIDTVHDPAMMQIFVDTFNRAYSGTDPREPYGQAPPEWGETLLSSFGKELAGRSVDYYLLFEQGQPASVLLSSCLRAFGGIYSVGTAPEFRGKGYASMLTLHAAHQLIQRGQREIFLQTEKSSYNERLYSKLGFVTEWAAEAWCK
jgi:ribosomal protein S18 acetylase RimI-like enzyme